jgi:hypothetical protein
VTDMSEQATPADLSYRDWLVKAHHVASQDFDKALMALSGGALGISLAFIHDVALHPHRKGWLEVSWGSLAASLLLILVSFLTSQSALSPRPDTALIPIWVAALAETLAV